MLVNLLLHGGEVHGLLDDLVIVGDLNEEEEGVGVRICVDDMQLGGVGVGCEAVIFLLLLHTFYTHMHACTHAHTHTHTHTSVLSTLFLGGATPP